jgi:hypothetical protein
MQRYSFDQFQQTIESQDGQSCRGSVRPLFISFQEVNKMQPITVAVFLT